ncbi:otogelin [Dendropsophus ebraccatus]|uniref:otogelin n=1 Tax=Dendropsophus ebraccatus TaxID=150705 RepID=UPI003831D610
MGRALLLISLLTSTWARTGFTSVLTPDPQSSSGAPSNRNNGRQILQKADPTAPGSTEIRVRGDQPGAAPPEERRPPKVKCDVLPCFNGGECWQKKFCDCSRYNASGSRCQIVYNTGPERENICRTWGQYHYETFDGVYFFFPGKLTYDLVRHVEADEQSFAIQVHNGGSCALGPDACSRSVSLYFAGAEEVTLQNRIVLLNNLRVELPYVSGGLRIQRVSGYILLTQQYVFSLAWDGHDAIYVKMSPDYVGRTRGLCGNNNWILHDDLITSYGKVTENIEELVNSWREDAPQKSLLPPVPPTVYEPPCAAQKPLERQVAHSLCSALLQAPFQSCHELVSPLPFMASCADDLCMSDGDVGSWCRALTEYARTCAHAGHPLQGWRNVYKKCDVTCDPGFVYRECIQCCPTLCHQRKPCMDSEISCVDGCYCPEGMVLENGTCVHPTECPCDFHGVSRQPGAVVQDQCNNCTCSGGKWVCTELTCPAECSVTGDFHIMTFDGRKYTFPAPCQYILAKSLSSGTFTVSLQNAPCGSNLDGFCIQSVNLVIHQDQRKQVILTQSGDVYMYDQYRISMPYTDDVFEIRHLSSVFVQVRTSLGLRLLYDRQGLRLYLQVDGRWKDDTTGLCGTFNDNTQDDFLSPAGVPESTPQLFGNSWKTSSGCGVEYAPPPLDPCDVHLQAASYAVESCSVVSRELFSPCHPYLSPVSYYEQCRRDTCKCGDACLCSTLAHYAHQCRHYGVIINFRAAMPACGIPCRGLMVYSTCVRPCGQTCQSLSTPDACDEEECVEGCACPENMYYSTKLDTCVERNQCPCHLQGIDYHPGDIVLTALGKCLCTDGVMTCERYETVHSCPAGQIYHNCSAPEVDGELSPEKTCENQLLNLTAASNLPCVSGCVCPRGLVKHGAECLEPDACPCSWKAKEYFPGDVVQSSCHTCVCHRGAFQCSFRPCPAMCSFYGDRHYRTFDGLTFDFVGSCKVHLVKALSSRNFSVTAENVNCYSSGGVCRKVISISVGQSVILFTDDSGTPSPSSVVDEAQEVHVWQAGFFTFVHFPLDYITLLWDQRTTLHIQAGPQWQGALAGLCGNFDLKTVNEMRTPDELELTNPQEFGNSWTTAECSETPETRSPCHLNPLREPFAKKECGILLSEVFEACHPVVDVTWFYSNCLSDTCGCSRGGDCECFCTSVAAYAHQCCQQGITVDWRSPRTCPYDCEFYNKVLGKGPYRLHSYGDRGLVVAARMTDASVIPMREEREMPGHSADFMVTPGLFSPRVHDKNLVSLESAERPNYFIHLGGNGTLHVSKWQRSQEFQRRATFIIHKNRWTAGYSAFESLAKPGHFVRISSSFISLTKYHHSAAFRLSTLFRLSDSKFRVIPRSTCEWRYDACTIACYRTCRDPAGERCHSVPRVEGCFPSCTPDMVMDEVTKKCVYFPDCIEPAANLTTLRFTTEQPRLTSTMNATTTFGQRTVTDSIRRPTSPTTSTTAYTPSVSATSSHTLSDFHTPFAMSPAPGTVSMEATAMPTTGAAQGTLRALQNVTLAAGPQISATLTVRTQLTTHSAKDRTSTSPKPVSTEPQTSTMGRTSAEHTVSQPDLGAFPSTTTTHFTLISKPPMNATSISPPDIGPSSTSTTSTTHYTLVSEPLVNVTSISPPDMGPSPPTTTTTTHYTLVSEPLVNATSISPPDMGTSPTTTHYTLVSEPLVSATSISPLDMGPSPPTTTTTTLYTLVSEPLVNVTSISPPDMGTSPTTTHYTLVSEPLVSATSISPLDMGPSPPTTTTTTLYTLVSEPLVNATSIFSPDLGPSTPTMTTTPHYTLIYKPLVNATSISTPGITKETSKALETSKSFMDTGPSTTHTFLISTKLVTETKILRYPTDSTGRLTQTSGVFSSMSDQITNATTEAPKVFTMLPLTTKLLFTRRNESTGTLSISGIMLSAQTPHPTHSTSDTRTLSTPPTTLKPVITFTSKEVSGMSRTPLLTYRPMTERTRATPTASASSPVADYRSVHTTSGGLTTHVVTKMEGTRLQSSMGVTVKSTSKEANATTIIVSEALEHKAKVTFPETSTTRGATQPRTEPTRLILGLRNVTGALQSTPQPVGTLSPTGPFVRGTRLSSTSPPEEASQLTAINKTMSVTMVPVLSITQMSTSAKTTITLAPPASDHPLFHTSKTTLFSSPTTHERVVTSLSLAASHLRPSVSTQEKALFPDTRTPTAITARVVPSSMPVSSSQLSALSKVARVTTSTAKVKTVFTLEASTTQKIEMSPPETSRTTSRFTSASQSVVASKTVAAYWPPAKAQASLESIAEEKQTSALTSASSPVPSAALPSTTSRPSIITLPSRPAAALSSSTSRLSIITTPGQPAAALSSTTSRPSIITLPSRPAAALSSSTSRLSIITTPGQPAAALSSTTSHPSIITTPGQPAAALSSTTSRPSIITTPGQPAAALSSTTSRPSIITTPGQPAAALSSTTSRPSILTTPGQPAAALPFTTSPSSIALPSRPAAALSSTTSRPSIITTPGQPAAALSSTTSRPSIITTPGQPAAALSSTTSRPSILTTPGQPAAALSSTTSRPSIITTPGQPAAALSSTTSRPSIITTPGQPAEALSSTTSRPSIITTPGQPAAALSSTTSHPSIITTPGQPAAALSSTTSHPSIITSPGQPAAALSSTTSRPSIITTPGHLTASEQMVVTPELGRKPSTSSKDYPTWAESSQAALQPRSYTSSPGNTTYVPGTPMYVTPDIQDTANQTDHPTPSVSKWPQLPPTTGAASSPIPLMTSSTTFNETEVSYPGLQSSAPGITEGITVSSLLSTREPATSQMCTPYTENDCIKHICVDGQLIQVNKSQHCPYNVTQPSCGLLGFAVQINGDRCCPKWECACRCSIFSDLSFVTFDGRYLALYKEASYILTLTEDESITVQVSQCGYRGQDNESSVPLCLSLLELTYLSNQILIHRLNRKVVVNSRNAWPMVRKYGYKIVDTGNMYLIDTPSDIKIQWFHSTGLMIIESNSTSKPTSMGLCGYCDGNATNDLILPTGHVLSKSDDSEEFVDSWQVPYTLKYVGNERHRDVNCSVMDCSACVEMILNHVFSSCNPYVSPDVFCELWVKDVEYTQDPCKALAAYTAMCHKFNVCIEWRTPDFCPFRCPPSLIYRACLPVCEVSPTCQNNEIDLYGSESCAALTEGCVCAEGEVLHYPYTTVCIAESKCACTDSAGTPREIGEVWRTPGAGCCTYQCVDNDTIIPLQHNCSERQERQCRRQGEVLVSLSSQQTCCPQKLCVCNETLCDDVIPVCRSHEKLTAYYQEDSCCPRYSCECDPARCARMEMVAPCREDQTLLTAASNRSCCLTSFCGCNICSEPVPTCQEGETLSVISNTTQRCCPTYQCVCDVARCPDITCDLGMSGVELWTSKSCCPYKTCECSCDKINKPKCDVGEKLERDAELLTAAGNPCNCTIYRCVKDTVCVSKDHGVLRPGQTVVQHTSEGMCYSTHCTAAIDPITKYHMINVSSLNCAAICEVNQLYEPPSDVTQCCGRCRNVSCVQTTLNGTILTHRPGSTWISKCVRYDCTNTPVGPVLVTSAVSCPPFNETECIKMGGYVVSFLDGCCKTCKEDGKFCKRVTVRMTIRKNDCRSNTPVNIVSCDGKCPSASIYNYNINTYARFCKCCRELGLQRRVVQLYCSGNSTWVNYSIQEPTDCSCQWS